MTISIASRWIGNRDDVVRLAGQMRKIMQGHGASDMLIHQIYAGENAGQWLVVLQYPDWETYGKGMQASSNDPAYLELFAEAAKVGQFLGRTLLTSVEF